LNWASSLDSTGATPGRVNSRTFPSSGAAGDVLTREPNPFSPDGDGRDDLLFIRYRLNHADSRLDLTIYDVRGREVRQLANNAAATYSGEILWDGKDGAGRDLPTGLYIVYLEALGKGGTRVQSAKRAVALARRS
jgi:flagellar hook assembly protein FlgD